LTLGNQEGSSSRAVDNTIDEDEEDLMKSPFLMNDLTDSGKDQVYFNTSLACVTGMMASLFATAL